MEVLARIGMSVNDVLVIIAIILGPILAVQVQKIIESRGMKRERKKQIFRTLMATRATRLSPFHVEALNMIDIEFHDNKTILEAWRLLLDNFYNYPKDIQDPQYQTLLVSCTQKSEDLFIDLLYEISRDLRYTFDKVQLKRGCYIPQGHVEIELEQTFIRKSLADVFTGKKSIPIRLVEGLPEDHERIS